MRTPVLGLSALALAALASPALAQEAPASDFTVSGGATLVSDYRFRGISQTNKRFAVQGSLSVTHSSGFYGSVWGSSIDDYIANGGDQEIDLTVGYSHTLANGIKLDGGLLYYYYPGSGGINSDFFEPYIDVSGTIGPVSAKVTANYAWKQNALTIGNGREDNLYVAGDFGYAVPNTALAFSAHIGHSFGPSYLIPSPTKDYTDWGVGASYTWNHLTLGVNYVDTDKDVFSAAPPAAASRNITKAGVVFSLGVAF